MWQRLKRLIRSIIGWFIELGEDPELILKQNIRDLQDQVPQINENLATVKAQVTLVKKDLERLNQKEADLTAKIKAALKSGRRDLALPFATSLEEIRREKTQQEQQLKIAESSYVKADKFRKAFLKQIQEKIQDANKALSAKRQAQWQGQVADAMASFQAYGLDATHDEMIEQIERDAAKAEAKLEMAMDTVDAGNVDIEEEVKNLQANETLRAFEMEMGLGGDVSAPPEAPETAEKTLGERETA